jgi:RHS repeat-associated protein
MKSGKLRRELAAKLLPARSRLLRSRVWLRKPVLAIASGDRSLLLRRCCFASLALLLCGVSFAQSPVNDGNNVGFPTNGVFDGSAIDAVQLQNYSLHIQIPVATIKGRGLSLKYQYVWDPLNFFVVLVGCDPVTGFCRWKVNSNRNTPNVGWRFTNSASFGVTSAWVATGICGSGTSITVAGNSQVTDPSGTAHNMIGSVAPQGQYNKCFTAPAVVYAEDGSGLVASADAYGIPTMIFTKQGTLIDPFYKQPGWTNVGVRVRDANGNQIILNNDNQTITDTLGRPQPASPDSLGHFSYYDSNGVQQTISVTYQSVSYQTHLCGDYSGPNDACTEASGTLSEPQQIIFPNGLKYTFDYTAVSGNPTWGQPNSVTVPTGATISWSWTIGTRGLEVTSRSVTANGTTATTLYGTDANDPNVNTVVTDALGNDTKHTFTQINPAQCQSCSALLQETLVQYFQGHVSGGVLMKSVQTDYSSAGLVLPVRTTTRLDPTGVNTVTKRETDWDSFLFQWDGSYGNLLFSWSNPVEVREYDYGAGAPGSLVRSTDYSYLHLSSATYRGLNIAAHPTSEVVHDGAGNIAAQTAFTYDSYSNPVTQQNGITGTSGVPGHDANFSSSYLSRGNLTQKAEWLNTTNSYLPATIHMYDDLGNVLSVTDPNSHTTTFSYSDDWSGSACLPAANSFAFRTDVSNALGQHTHTTYYPCTGQAQATKDQNDINAGRAGTTFAYDSMNRPLCTGFPDGGQTCLSHNDTLPMSITKTVKASPDPDIVSSVQLDDLGRTNLTHLVDPEGDVYTKTTYDAWGRKQREYNPTRCNPPDTNCGTEPTWGFTSYAYDALSRTTDITKQDGNVVHADYSGKVTTVTDETGRQRRSTTDGLGRLIEVDEPGDAHSATAASGAITISGTLQSVTTGGHSGTTASGSVTISGTEQRQPVDPECTIRCQFIYDAGTVTITVNGFSKTVSFGQGSSTFQIASNLANVFNADGASPVSASTGGAATVTLTSYAASGAANYSLSSSHTWDSGDFANSSFTTSNSGSTLTGGTDAVNPTTTYDAGTVTLSLPGYSAQANYGGGSGQDSTAPAVALDLYNQIKAQLPASSPPFSISLPSGGTTITFNWNSAGAAGNVTVSSTATTTQTASFSKPSFAACTPITANPQNCSVALSGGTDAYPSGVAHPYVTQYSYDGLGNLTCAVQKGMDTSAFSTCSAAPLTWRPRSFTYDSLSRLLTANNPESGQTSYQYDSDGNVVSKTDARGVTINYNPSDSPIDALNRVTKKTYSNGDPPATYTYDQGAEGVGRLTSAASGSASSAVTYDPMGRVKSETNCLPSSCSGTSNQVSALYDAAGALTSLTYPDGRAVTSGYNAAGRMIGVTLGGFGGATVNVPYYTVPQSTSPSAWGYWPSGAMNRGTFGNGVIETTTYNNRLQTSSIAEARGATTLFSKSYGFYDGSGHNNGDILSITDGLSSTQNQTYTYDSLNRILSGSQADSAFSVNYTYDAWGNMKESGTSNFQPLYDVRNRIPSPANCNPVAQYCYDAAGDLLQDNNNHVYTYDGEARIKTVDGTTATYTYGADGQRVRKDANGSSTEYVYFGGNVIAEKNPGTGAWTDYIFGYGKRIAKDTSSDGVGAQYYQDDHLGSARIMTDNTGTVISNCTFSAFGEQVSCSPDNPSNHYRFTGKERDAESGLDYFGARYYGSNMGRWLSPDGSDDPDTVPFANFQNPQTLNLYSYVQNIPLSRRDADGHVTCSADSVTWGPHGVTVTAGECHLDLSDYLTISYYAMRAMQNFVQDRFGRDFQTLQTLTNVAFAVLPDCGCDNNNDQKDKKKNDQKSSSGEREATTSSKSTSPNQMNQQVQRGQAPNSVDRVDSPRFPHEKPHIEFKDGNALNNDGTWKHGGRELTNGEKEWITNNGWSLPK